LSRLPSPRLFFFTIRRPPRSTPFPTRRSSDLLQIVGIVGDVHESGLTTGPRPEFYVPFVVHPPQRAYLAVRTRTDPLTLASGVRDRKSTRLNSSHQISSYPSLCMTRKNRRRP